MRGSLAVVREFVGHAHARQVARGYRYFFLARLRAAEHVREVARAEKRVRELRRSGSYCNTKSSKHSAHETSVTDRQRRPCARLD